MPQHQTQVSTQDLIQEISRVSERNIHQVITIKAVYVRNASGVWEYLLGKCEVGRDEVPDEKIYSDYAFVSKSIKNVSWERLFKDLSSEGYEVSENLPAIKNSGSPNISWTRHLIPSHATTHGYPAKKYTATINNGVYFTDGPLIKYGLPFFESSQIYIKNFLDLDSFWGGSDGRKGEFSLEIPDYSARIKFENESLFIESDTDDICMVGSSSFNRSITLFAQDRIQLNLSDLSSSELWLINKNDEILDFRSKSHWKYKVKIDDNASAKNLLTLIESGESQTLEFKSYIDVAKQKNSKAEEIEKTVCAFANVYGGKLLIGISDEGNVDGIDKSVLEIYQCDLESAVSQYISGIKKRLTENLKNNQCYEIYSCKVGDKYVVCIDVSRSEELNYCVNQDWAFIRVGATSRKMRSVEDRPKMPRSAF